MTIQPLIKFRVLFSCWSICQSHWWRFFNLLGEPRVILVISSCFLWDVLLLLLYAYASHRYLLNIYLMPGIFLDIDKTDYFLSFKKLIELGDADYQIGLVQQVLSALNGTGDLRLTNPVRATWGMPQGDFQISMSIVCLSFTLLLLPILGYIIFRILIVHHQS